MALSHKMNKSTILGRITATLIQTQILNWVKLTIIKVRHQNISMLKINYSFNNENIRL